MAEPHVPVSFNHLCCRICNEVLRNPTIVPCGHSFCMQCLQDYWDCNERIECPECSCLFTSRPQLIRNTALAELMRDMERCDNGSEKRKQQDTGASHQVPKRPRTSSETKTSEGNLCGKHNSPLEVYCCTDEVVLCGMCASAEHRGHRFGQVVTERRRKQEELKNIQIKSKQILQQQEKKWKNMKKLLKEIGEDAKQTLNYCDGVVVSVIDSLQRHYLSVRQLLEAQEKATRAQVQISQQSLKAKIEEMKQRDVELDCLAETESDVGFLRQWPSLRLLCVKDHLHEALEDPLLPFEFTKRTVGQIGRRLETFLDEEFRSISQTADSEEQQESAGETQEEDTEQGWKADLSQSHDFSGVSITQIEQNVEPTTRAQFLQYACELTLDPTTAHEDLIVSAGDKEVKLSPLITKNPCIRYPERFIHRRQVLCREGLQAERCYYEIEVEGDKVEIALAYKAIDRKSRTKLSAFGGNINSWSLDRAKTYSVTHNNDGVMLTNPPSHHKIGVYLKFKEGTLSFYEVSDSMKFLYKVEAKFTQSLYPGFWLGEKSCIRISDLKQE